MTPTAIPEAELAEPPARRSRLRWLPVAVGVVAVAATMAVLARPDVVAERVAPTTTTLVPAGAVEVASDAPTYTSLDELVAASDVVVAGHVTSVARGRTFGDGEAAMESRLVHLAVDRVLHGELPDATTALLVEEEGWTADGAPLVVDGAVPTRAEDRGIWFLVDTGDETGAWITVNAQGRYLVAGGAGEADGRGRLTGRLGDDPLVAQLVERTLDELAEEISRTPPRP